jgi:hypothetical protein
MLRSRRHASDVILGVIKRQVSIAAAGGEF